jgi:ABC-type branched-subunit amino acid transport system ATPase component
LFTSRRHPAHLGPAPTWLPGTAPPGAAIGRALVGDPRVLILDEPSPDLARGP